METTSQKRSATLDDDQQKIPLNKKKKTNESPMAGTRITDWDEYEKWKEVRGDIEPTMNYVEITPEAVEELSKIKNLIGDYICQLCKVKYENAFALAMHKCPRVVHIEFRCPECDKTFNCPANLASHRRWHKPQASISKTESPNRTSTVNRHPRSSSRSDSRSTNTSTSTVSESNTAHDSSSISSDLSKKSPLISSAIHQKASEHILRTMFNGNSQRLLPSSLHNFSNPFIKHPSLFPHPPMPMTTSFDLRRLQSSCIFCHEQFTDLSHLLQHIRKNHSVSSTNNSKTNSMTFDKLLF